MKNAFPPAWIWLVDEAIPEWVKTAYSPDDRWKNKPFGKQDLHFFSRSILELSEFFADATARRKPDYFNHPKYRSAYLLYFLPLQCAKFLVLLDRHPKAWEAALDHAFKNGIFRAWDLGCGPATASLALLLKLGALPSEDLAKISEIEIELVDSNPAILKEAKKLSEFFVSRFPRLRGKLKIKTHLCEWWKMPKLPHSPSLIFLGHVLNEGFPQKQGTEFFESLIERADGGGILFAEPAEKRASQTLSQIRDHLLDLVAENRDKSAGHLWGPCLHEGLCPLSDGRDWCHFSVPVLIPGKWFKAFSEVIGSERQWVKYSYLWIASKNYPSPKIPGFLRLVVSDPLIPKFEGKINPQASGSVLVCEPEEIRKEPLSRGKKLFRGDTMTVKK